MLNLGRICMLWMACGCGVTLICVLYGFIGIVAPAVESCVKNNVSDDDISWVLKPITNFGNEVKNYSTLEFIGNIILNMFVLWPVNTVVKMQKLIKVRHDVKIRAMGAVYGTVHWKNSRKESTEN